MDLDAQKCAVIGALLPLCPFILVDSRLPGVLIREDLVLPELVLRLGRNPAVMGIPDLELTSAGFSATLSFRGRQLPVKMPWAAVSRAWVAEPFEGPAIFWPPDTRPAAAAETPARGLRVVKGSPD